MKLQDRASFYQMLHRGTESGLTLQQVLAAGILPSTTEAVVARLQKELEKGASLNRALTVTGVVSPWEADIIYIGETSGRLESVLLRLAEFFTQKVDQLRHLKGKLVYPLLTLLFAIVVLPLPALSSGALSVARYLLQSGLALLLLNVIYRQLLVRPISNAEMGSFNPLLLKSLEHVSPEHFLRMQFEIAYMDLLTLCLESGMDAVHSLKVLQRCFKGRDFRSRHVLAINKVETHGLALSDALSMQGILQNSQIVSYMKVCEASGTLHTDMVEFIQRKKKDVSNTVDYWIRRISGLIYTLVVIYVSMKIMGL